MNGCRPPKAMSTNARMTLVAGIYQEIRIAAFLDRLSDETRQRVSFGMAKVEMVLNGLSFSNCRF